MREQSHFVRYLLKKNKRIHMKVVPFKNVLNSQEL